MIVSPASPLVVSAAAPLDPPSTAEQLLRLRDTLPPGHPDRLALRTRVIEEHLALAGRLARRYARRGEPADDLAQVAALALVKAVDRYDPSRPAAFTSYAVPCILGALKRHFRDTTWGVRVPRPTQELTLQLADATAELGHRYRRTPTPVELASHLRVTVDQFAAATHASQAYKALSIDGALPGGGGAGALAVTDPGFVDVDDHLSLLPLIAALPARERRILGLRFFGNLTQSSIAAELGISQMHVSRLLRQSLGRLRAGLESDEVAGRGAVTPGTARPARW
jgi:RNA polymerase sigma-B factor